MSSERIPRCAVVKRCGRMFRVGICLWRERRQSRYTKTQQQRLQKYGGWMVCSVLATLLLLEGFGQTRNAAPGEKKRQGAAIQLAAAPDRDGYVGSASCSRCHLGIYKQFSRTSMGRSMSPITPELLQTLTADLYDDKLDRHFEVHARAGKLYQSEYQTDAGGKEIFRDTHELDWIIGAGANGFGSLLQRDNYLFQSPLSFYSKPGTWGPSPGYEFGDYGFNRPILSGFISCHSCRPRPRAATNLVFEPPPFTEMAIGCENCHVPGAAPIRAMKS